MYGSLSAANTFHTTYDLDGTWATYSDARKTAALNRATQQIDRVPFDGRRYQYDQSNEFPRILYEFGRNIYFDVDTSGSVVVPTAIEHATYIQAKFLLDTRENDTIRALELGITSLSAGQTSQNIDKDLLPVDPTYGLCAESMNLIKRFRLFSL